MGRPKRKGDITEIGTKPHASFDATTVAPKDTTATTSDNRHHHAVLHDKYCLDSKVSFTNPHLVKVHKQPLQVALYYHTDTKIGDDFVPAITPLPF